MTRQTASALAAACLVAGLAVTGYWMLFSNLAVYDDEGYVLISVREYFAHGGLYQGVYSQYGPAIFVLADLFQHAAGLIDHSVARFITLALWLGTAVCCAGLVLRQTASRRLAAFVLTAVFLYLYFITDEPFHPGSLIIFVLALAMWVLTTLIDCRRLAAATLVAGATTALLTLTKINVGAFFFAGTAAWALLHATPERHRRAAGALALAAVGLFALALMHTLWAETWVQVYLAVFAAGALGLCLLVPAEPLLNVRHAGVFIASGVGTALVILAAVWLRGTSPAGLLDGVLLGPLRHPNNYSYPVDWRPGTGLAAALGGLLAVAYPWIERRYSAAAADRLVVGLRLLQVLGLLVGLALLMQFRVVGAIFSYMAPLLWTWVVPLRPVTTSRSSAASRGLLAWILLLQYLHAYPVGGSQESWGTFLFIPLVALGLAEIRGWFVPSRPATLSAPRWWTALACGLLLVPVAKAGWSAVAAHRRYAERSDLGLPGAEKLRLTDAQRTAYRILALNAVVHGDQLFSLPGLFSFNLWTDLPTPTSKNTTLWFTLLNDAEQAAIRQSLAHAARPCIIVQESLVQLMRAGKVPIHGLLVDYIQHQFAVAFRVEGFAFLVRNDRTIAPLAVARQRSPSATSGGELEFSLVSENLSVTSIEVSDLSTPLASPHVLNATNSRLTVVPINRAGQPLGSPRDAPWPLQAQGLVRVSLKFDRAGLELSPYTTLLCLKDAEHRVVGEVRLEE